MTIRIVLGCICLLFLAQARAQELRSFQEGGRYGFKKGNEVIIPALYSYASEFSDGAALVKENASWGFLKENGEWLVKPSFDNAQPFHDGFALVLKGGKYGLIDRFGKLVVPMAFNKIVKDWDGFQLFGEKLGYYNPKWGTYIPSEFDKIDHARFFSIARKGNEYFIFHDGKQLATTKYIPQLAHYNHPFLDMKKLDGTFYYGILDTNGVMVIPQVYTGFQLLNVQEYHIEPNDPGYFYVYELDSTVVALDEYTMEYNVFGPTQKRVLNAQLQPIHPGLCFNVQVQEGMMQLIVNDQLATMQSDGTLKYSKYNYVNLLGGRLIASGKDGVDILNRKDSTILAHFGSFAIPSRMVFDIDPETGEERSYGADLPYQLILVSEASYIYTDTITVAFYDPWSLSLVTAYSDAAVNFEELVGDHTFTALIMRSGENNFNYWIPGMKPISNYPFTYLKYVGGQFFMASEGNGTFLFSWITGKRFPIDGDGTAVWSTTLSEEHLTINYETDENNWTIANPYDVPFVRLNYANGKYGVIDPDERLYFGPFDSIVQVQKIDYKHDKYLLQVYDGELCGMINLLTGEYISPRFSGPLNMKFDGSAWNFYALEDEIHPRKYISSKGRSLDGLPEEPVFYKEKGKMGGRIYAPHKDTMVDWIPPIYKALNYTEFFLNFKAQDTRTKKWGLLDMAGDTLVPFAYDRFVYREMNLGMGDFMALELYNKKKLGLYYPVRKKIIPAVYDRIDEIETSDYNNNLLLAVSKGKTALYRASDFDEILPCEYDGISVVEYIEKERLEVRVVKNGKTAIVWLNNYDQLKQLKIKLNQAVWYDLVFGDNAYIKTASGWQHKNLATDKTEVITELKELYVFDLEQTFQVEDDKIGFKNAKGKWILPNKYTSFLVIDGSILGFENGILMYFECAQDAKECRKHAWNEW
jgi:hypothetical protein